MIANVFLLIKQYNKINNIYANTLNKMNGLPPSLPSLSPCVPDAPAAKKPGTWRAGLACRSRTTLEVTTSTVSLCTIARLIAGRPPLFPLPGPRTPAHACPVRRSLLPPRHLLWRQAAASPLLEPPSVSWLCPLHRRLAQCSPVSRWQTRDVVGGEGVTGVRRQGQIVACPLLSAMMVMKQATSVSSQAVMIWTTPLGGLSGSLIGRPPSARGKRCSDML